ncbi:MAG: hypothetical protein ACJAYX_003579 [Planctomycetota bacterium]|jgi:hypothetical protein
MLATSLSAQQCFTATGNSIAGIMVMTLPPIPANDYGRSPPIALNGFTFPIGGANWTHFVVDADGVIYLTMGGAEVNPAAIGVTNLSELRGGPGGSPRIGAFTKELRAAPGQPWDILVDDSVAGEVKISWVHVTWSGGVTDFAMGVKLFATGAVQFDYGAGLWPSATSRWACISAGNDVGTGTEVSSDLSAGGSVPIELVFEGGFNPFDMRHSSLLFTPSGGGYQWTQTCLGNAPASNSSYGNGCYDRSTWASVYQQFATAPDAKATLENAAFAYLPDGLGGYILFETSASASLRSIANATLLPLCDDCHAAVVPSIPFNYLGTTPVSSLELSSNGVLFMNSFGQNPLIVAYGLGGFLQVTQPMFAAYGSDLDPGASGGSYYVEEDNGVLYITADGVYQWSTTDPSTFQYQLELATGFVTIVYGTLGNVSISPVLFGFTPAGTVADMGGIDLLTELPFTTSVDGVDPALALSASPAPLSTGAVAAWPNAANFGATLTYQVNNAPESATGTGTALGLIILSSSQNTGLDLGFIGAPGCSAYINSLDVPVAFVNAGTSASVQFQLPAGLPSGAQFYTQAVALSDGVNAFGLLTSNAIASVISDN